MNEFYGNWKVIKAPSKACYSTKGLRTELLGINYDLNNENKHGLDDHSQEAIK